MQGPKREDYFKAKHGDASIPPAGAPIEIRDQAARQILRKKWSVQLLSQYRKKMTRAEEKKFIDSYKLTKPPNNASLCVNRSRLLLFEVKKWDYVDLLSHACLPLLKRLSY